MRPPLKRSFRSAQRAVRPQKEPVMIVKTKRKPCRDLALGSVASLRRAEAGAC